jgi:protein TonB
LSAWQWWIAALAAAIVHAVVLVVPLRIDPRAPASAPQPVVLRFATPPEPEVLPPPPPEPEPPPEPPPPEPADEPPPPKPERPRPPEPSAPVSTPAPAAPAEPPPPVTPAPAIDPVPTSPRADVVVPKPAPPAPPRPPADIRPYARSMRDAFLRNRNYPVAALRLRLEGVVKVKLSVDRKGRLVGAPSVVQSSGHTVLDDEALRVVKASAPFDPLPQGVEKDPMLFVIPIDFHIRE